MYMIVHWLVVLCAIENAVVVGGFEGATIFHPKTATSGIPTPVVDSSNRDPVEKELSWFVPEGYGRIGVKENEIDDNARRSRSPSDWFRTIFNTNAVEDPRGRHIYPTEGAVPTELHGTLYRNGPARWANGQDEMPHLLEGDGLISAVTFKEGKAVFRSRFVETEAYKNERAAGKRLYRCFSNIPGGFLKNVFHVHFKNPININAVYFGGKVFALHDAGRPYAMDPLTLETKGPCRYDCDTQQVSLKDAEHEEEDPYTGVSRASRPQEVFSGHYHIDENDDLVAFANCPNGRLILYHIDEEGNYTRKPRKVQLDQFSSIHDFSITDKYALFFNGPMALNSIGLLTGLDMISSISSSRNMKQKSKILIVPRKSDSEEPFEVELGSRCFNYHIANSYEEGHEIVMDLHLTHDFTYKLFGTKPNVPVRETMDLTIGPRTTLHRLRINVQERRMVSCEKLIPDFDVTADLITVSPSVTGKRHRYIYIVGGIPNNTDDQNTTAYPTTLGKVDVEGCKTGKDRFKMWQSKQHEFLTEAYFIPQSRSTGNGEEDDGFLITNLYNGRTECAEVLIFNAQQIEAGPICRIPLPGHIGYSVHGGFFPNANFELSKILESCKAATLPLLD